MTYQNVDQVPCAFNKAKHIRYWLRCLKTLLPTAYTSNDSQRMTFAFFILSALDLLGALEDNVTAEERTQYIEWIYRCQHPSGGFRGFSGADAGRDTTDEGRCWDPANLAATFFALAALIVLGEPRERVQRDACLQWLAKLQRTDGSFGEALGRDDVIEGGGDIRYCYLAASVRYILGHADRSDVECFDEQNLVGYVKRSVSYEGGIGKAPFHEAHAGWTYCGIGVLKLLDQSQDVGPRFTNEHLSGDLLKWLVSRQTTYLEEEEEEDDDAEIANDTTKSQPEANYMAPSFSMDKAYPASPEHRSSPSVDPTYVGIAGFNGRCNKVADTCYAFWVGGSLEMLGQSRLQNRDAVRRYILGKTQHVIGGFGKICGDPPDILHSYLGLAALAVMEEPDIRPIETMLCISQRAMAESTIGRTMKEA